jgi:hypothetical protein
MYVMAENIVLHRRQLITGVPVLCGAASIPTNAATTATPTVDDQVAELARALEALHGGEWKTTSDEKGRFVLLCRH